MDNLEDKIRVRAYEIWERQGRTGHPEDHWHEAERQVRAQEGSTESPQDHTDATVQEAPPIKAVEAVEVAHKGPANPRRSPRQT
jgi:hypothetical protein